MLMASASAATSHCVGKGGVRAVSAARRAGMHGYVRATHGAMSALLARGERCFSASAPVRGTFDHMADMPRLPVPDVSHTCGLYVETLEPLLTPDELAASTKAVQDFSRPDGEGAVLQGLLKEYAATKLNWLEEWWDIGYLATRLPNPVNINYGMWLNMPSVPASSGFDEQISTAARLIVTALQFQELVETEQLEPETVRGTPLCMNQVARLFGHARIPRKDCDELVKYGKLPSGLPFAHFATKVVEESPKHVTVLAGGRFFKLQVRDASGVALAGNSIASGLQTIRDAAKREPLDPSKSIVTLSAQDRDLWAASRAALEQDPKNAESLRGVDSGLFVLVLDDEDASDADAVSESLLHGKKGNRWFDKHQLIVFRDGDAGANFEHAPGDGTTALAMVNHMHKNFEAVDLASAASSAAARVESIDFDVSRVSNDILAAGAHLDQMAAGLSTKVLQLPKEDAYGSTMIKTLGASPDAFVQVTMQAVAELVANETLATYESNSTRGFLHGRTETVRSASTESKKFALAFANNESDETVAALFRDAVARHSYYMKVSKDGMGVDRHLYGLMKIGQEAGRPAHDIFEDPAYTKSCTWRLSTSHLGSPATKLFNFGPVTGDGFGVGYCLHPEHVSMNVTSFEATPGSAAQFVETFAECMARMRKVLENQS